MARPEWWDCASPEHQRCLINGQEFDCRLPATKRTYRIATRQDLEDALEDIRERHPLLDSITACHHMRVCPVSLLDAFSMEAWRCYQIAQSGRSAWGLSWYEEPAIAHQAFAVIGSEIGRIEAERKRLGDK